MPLDDARSATVPYLRMRGSSMTLTSVRSVEAFSRDEWLTAVRMGLVVVDQRRAPNATRVAKAIADPSVSTYDSGFPTLRGWSLRDLARVAECSHQQADKGTRTLAELGLVLTIDGAHGTRDRRYVLMVPQELRNRVEYGQPMHAPTPILLNGQQSELRDKLTAYVDGPPTAEPFIVHGYAGTGKTAATTSILREHFGQHHDDAVAYLAPSGKAAAVLRQRGVIANTIHHALYSPTSDTDARGRPLFVKKTSGLTLDELRQRTVVVVDEASMVSAKTSAWISENATRVIALGDPMQLPPVDGVSEWCGPEAQPDHVLTQEVRYDNDTVQQRLGRALRQHSWRWAELDRYIDSTKVYDPRDFDAVVVWTNDQRWQIIDTTRDALGSPRGAPVAGDVLIFRRNRVHDRRLPEHPPYLGPDDAYNGQQSTILAVLGRETILRPVTYVYSVREEERQTFEVWRLWVKDHDSGRCREVSVYHRGLLGGVDHEDAVTHLTRGHKGRPIHAATFGHVVTAHKAQGSGFGRVLVVDASASQRRTQTSDFARRWLYTAITRAEAVATIARPSQVAGIAEQAA